MRISDEGIVARVQDGEKGAFEQIFQRHYCGIRSYLLHSLNGEDADDLSVEVFVRAYQGLSRFNRKSDGSFTAYLYTIARNLMRDASRRRGAWGGGRVEVSLPEASDAEPDGDLSLVEDLVVSEETATRIRDALQCLPPDDREVIVLSYQEELSARDIMAVTNKPSEAAVRQHLCRALRRLRALVRQDSYFAEESAGGCRR